MRSIDQNAARTQARQAATYGIALLAQAFNHCQNFNVPYAYAPDVQARFKELACDLIELVESGEITPALARTPERDALFQRFMQPILEGATPPDAKNSVNTVNKASRKHRKPNSHGGYSPIDRKTKSVNKTVNNG